MAAFLAFLHHLPAFALVAFLAIEMVVLGGELTLDAAGKLRLADLGYGISAGLLLNIGPARVFDFERGAIYLLPHLDVHCQAGAVRDHRPRVDHPDQRVPVLAAAPMFVVFIQLFAAILVKGVG